MTLRGCTWIRDSAVAVDVDKKTVRCESGRTHRYRDLIIACGLVPDDQALPGIETALATPAVATTI